MENRTAPSTHGTTTGSMAGLPRIQNGLEFVRRWEANVLLNGLISGQRAHRILLEVVRRIAREKPRDQEAAFDRLNELQSFINAMEHPITGTPALDPKDLVLAFEHAKQAVLHTEPWHGPSRFRGHRHQDAGRKATAIQHVNVRHSEGR
jgi:hypothetical protein